MLAIQCNKPCIVWGDFNALLQNQDRLNGAAVTNTKNKDFADCIHDLSLNEMVWKVEYYTLSNRQLGSNRICSRFDRALGNDEWMLQYGHLVMEYRLPYISEHSPMIMDFFELVCS